jgi:hypothetical protein
MISDTISVYAELEQHALEQNVEFDPGLYDLLLKIHPNIESVYSVKESRVAIKRFVTDTKDLQESGEFKEQFTERVIN